MQKLQNPSLEVASTMQSATYLYFPIKFCFSIAETNSFAQFQVDPIKEHIFPPLTLKLDVWP